MWHGVGMLEKMVRNYEAHFLCLKCVCSTGYEEQVCKFGLCVLFDYIRPRIDALDEHRRSVWWYRHGHRQRRWCPPKKKSVVTSFLLDFWRAWDSIRPEYWSGFVEEV